MLNPSALIKCTVNVLSDTWRDMHGKMDITLYTYRYLPTTQLTYAFLLTGPIQHVTFEPIGDYSICRSKKKKKKNYDSHRASALVQLKFKVQTLQ